jgi:hypothetical protein
MDRVTVPCLRNSDGNDSTQRPTATGGDTLGAALSSAGSGVAARSCNVVRATPTGKKYRRKAERS